MSSIQNIDYICFGHINGTILAGWSPGLEERADPGKQPEQPQAATCRRLLKAAGKKMQPGEHQVLDWYEEGRAASSYLNSEGALLYILIVNDEYPDEKLLSFSRNLEAMVETTVFRDRQMRETVAHGEDITDYEFSNQRILQGIARLAADHDDWSRVVIPVSSSASTPLSRPIASPHPNNYGSVDKVARLEEKAEQVKTVMRNNMNRLLANTERIDQVEDEAFLEDEESRSYLGMADKTRSYFWWRDLRLKLMIATVALVLVIIVIVVVCVQCGIDPTQDCKKKQPDYGK